MRSVVTAAIGAAFALAGGVAMAQPAGLKQDSGAWVNADGKALYTYVNDTTPGKSVCNGPCANIWPPLTAAADAKPAGDWSVITRDDGSKQWAHKGKPVYTFGRDMPGKPPMGESVNGWKMVR